MIYRLLTIFTIAVVGFTLYDALSDTVRGVVGASRPIARRVDNADCCLIPANRGLYRGQ